MPELSVIVPIYNVQDFLRKCIDSILAQSYKNFELILVDDGSTDKSGVICDEYARNNTHIKLIHQKNAGLVAARKRGLSLATGEYVINIDGDDWIEEETFSTLMSIIKKENTDFVQFGYFVEKLEGSSAITFPECKRIDIIDRSSVMERWLRHFNNSGIGSQVVTKLFRRDIFEEAYSNVPEDMSNGEDYVSFFFLIQSAKNYSSTEKAFYHYRVREDSLSHCTSLDRLIKENYLTYYLNQLFSKSEIGLPENVLKTWLKDRLVWAFATMFSQGLGDELFISEYVFDIIPELLNKSIVLYGAGKVGKTLFVRLMNCKNVELVSWVDANSERIDMIYNIDPVETIKKKEFDLVVVAIKSEIQYNKIRQNLLDIGITEKKIIWAKPTNPWKD